MKYTLFLMLARAVKIRDDPNWNSADGYLENHYTDEGKSPYPVDYAVPNFGMQTDIEAGLNHIKKAESDLDHKWIIVKPGDPPPKDYPVPNFGMDRDIAGGLANIKVAEGIIDHKWKWKPDEYLKPKNHVVPYFMEGSTLDKDVQDTLAHATAAEGTTGKKWTGWWNNDGEWNY